MAVSKILPVCYKKHSYHSGLCLPCLLSSIPMSTDRLTSSDKREIWTCTQSKLRSRTKPGYVRSLSYDPVDVWSRIRQSESALAFYSNPTSPSFRVNIRIRIQISCCLFMMFTKPANQTRFHWWNVIDLII